MKRHPLQRLSDYVDVASIAIFRILFGIAITVDACLMSRDEIAFNWTGPSFLFKYFGFAWVHPLSTDGMVAVWWALRILGLCVALGFCYRAAMALFFLGIIWTFLISQSEYLNHVYLICLLSFLMMFIPADGGFAVNRRARRDHVPRWNLLILRFQVGVVYFFAGLAKLTPDWFAGHSLRFWFETTRDLPLIGSFFASEPVPIVIAWAGALFDLLIVPLMLVRRTRPIAFGVAVLFHVTNACVFDIGVFPWLMLAATTLYFDPSWPRRLIRGHAERVPPAGGMRSARPLVVMLALYVTTQLALPLRHWLYPGDVNWTEEGDLFAWRMKLRDKQGWSRFFVTHPQRGRTWMVDPATHLNPVQATRMSGQPDLVLQYAHFLAREADRNGYARAEVRARVMTSLNARKPQLLVDPRTDLAAQPRNLAPASWILPLDDTPETAPVATLTVQEAKELFAARRRAEQELAAVTRLANDTDRDLRAVDRELRNKFHVDPAGDYSLDPASGKLYRLRPDGAGSVAEQEIGTLSDGADARRFTQLAVQRRQLLARAEVLKRSEAKKLAEESDLFTRLQHYLQSEGSVDVFRQGTPSIGAP